MSVTSLIAFRQLASNATPRRVSPSLGYRRNFRHGVYSWRHDFLNEREAPVCKNNVTLRRQRRERAMANDSDALAISRVSLFLRKTRRLATAHESEIRIEPWRKRGVSRVPRVANGVAAINAKHGSILAPTTQFHHPSAGGFGRLRYLPPLLVRLPSTKQRSLSEF